MLNVSTVFMILGKRHVRVMLGFLSLCFTLTFPSFIFPLLSSFLLSSFNSRFPHSEIGPMIPRRFLHRRVSPFRDTFRFYAAVSMAFAKGDVRGSN